MVELAIVRDGDRFLTGPFGLLYVTRQPRITLAKHGFRGVSWERESEVEVVVAAPVEVEASRWLWAR
jgi:hypothetical protein